MINWDFGPWRRPEAEPSGAGASPEWSRTNGLTWSPAAGRSFYSSGGGVISAS